MLTKFTERHKWELGKMPTADFWLRLTRNFVWLNLFYLTTRPKKKMLCCPLPTDRKMRKNRVRFFLFFLCQIWAKNLLKFVFNGLKKHLHDLYIYAF